MSLSSPFIAKQDALFAKLGKDYDPDSVLLPYQKAWMADDSPLKIAEKSRRTGLTWAEAADAVLSASSDKKAGGCDHFYVGSGKDMAIEFIQACAMWAKHFNKAAGEIEEEILEDEDKDILTFNIKFASGYKIQALSSNPSNMRGRQGNVTIDEAAFHERLAEVLKAALALTMWGAKVRLISTHNGVDNLFNEIIQDSRAGKKRYSVHRLTIDDACDQGLYKRICQIRGLKWSQMAEDEWKANLIKDTATQEDAMEEYYCVPKQGGGVYLNRALLEARMVDAPIFRFEGSAEFNAWPEHLREAEIKDWCEQHLRPELVKLDAKTLHAFGEDFARSGDMTVIAPMLINQQLKRSIPFMVELKNVPFRNQEQILFYIGDRLPRLTGGALDARGNGQYLAEQAKYKYGGGRIQEVMLSEKWYLENMPKMKAALEDDTLNIPRDADVLNDFRAIQMVRGVPRIPEGQTSQGRHGDSAIAICLAYFASQMEIQVYSYHAVPKANASDDTDRPRRQIHTTAGFRRGML